MTSSASPSLGERAFVALQYALPKQLMSRLVYRATRSRIVPFKNALISAFVRGYRPEMQDAEQGNPLAYGSFNEFFTRELRAGSRPMPAEIAHIASPVDGTVSEAGRIDNNQLLQAKGHRYSLEALLVAAAGDVAVFRGGDFMTVYLAPYNYHRIHMPQSGHLVDCAVVPGELFSVNNTTASLVPGLFARNERVICRFAGEHGPFVMVLVGALHVGSMQTVWHGEITPRRPRRVLQLPSAALAAPALLDRGAEMGRFNMGSTVIVIWPPGTVQLDAKVRAGQVLRMGERVATMISRPAQPLSGGNNAV